MTERPVFVQLETLQVGLRELRIACSSEQLLLFRKYLECLFDRRGRLNLISRNDYQHIVTRHFLESLLALPYLPAGRFEACDIGSGAGFPGIPLRIVRPEMALTLVESRRKKADFLRAVIGDLGFANAEVAAVRAETMFDRSFDVILARAAGRIRDLLPTAAPMIKVGGLIVLYKGPKAEDEIAQARGLFGKYGVKSVRVERVRSPVESRPVSLVLLSR